MISIKKYLDGQSRPQAETAPASPITGLIANYRSALVAIAKNAPRDGSAHGEELASKLLGLDRRISTKPSQQIVSEAESELEASLDAWGKHAVTDAKQKVDEIKSVVLALAGAAEVIGARDQENAKQLSKVTEDIESVVKIDELRQIRSALVEHVTTLKARIEEMTKESRQVVTDLQQKVASYETKLKSFENLALTDLLTGVANRRSLEERINSNIEGRGAFCVVLFDLNRLKQINDNLGHCAGDEVLKQFASKLRENTRASDLMGRWGGDEFVLVVPGEKSHIAPLVYRIRGKVCTHYLVRRENGLLNSLEVDAAVGIAQWEPGETLEQILSRADSSMYEDKKRMKAFISTDENMKLVVS